MRNTNYTESLFDLLNWQGGTIHQVAGELGLEAFDLLYGQPTYIHSLGTPYWQGRSAFSTCSKIHVQSVLISQFKGNKDFWLGYMQEAYKAHFESLDK